ncbi:PREDICTED: taste receptor type 1 member 1-like, partial [Nestor notabilis]|uniref:taste receptor type 1 member 1-like n=1 Tax=Nestor notabilis TaxID=176057 RepID=UPI0005231963
RGGHEVKVLSAFHHYEPEAVAVIGPDSTPLTLTTASVLGVFLVPSISYEVSMASMSLKRFYPSFMRTIPSDRQQVKAIFQLLQHFGWTLVKILVDTKVNVTVVFSSRQNARSFFEVVVQRNVTGMVWVGSEDWSLARAVWQVPGIQRIGLVLGIWQRKALRLNVPAARHGLHDLLGCASGTCSKGPVYPWQLLQKIKQVNFTLYKSHISFDATGDIRKGYNIVMWKWNGPSWAFGVIGTFRVNPDRLSVDDDKILWHTEDGQAPTSVCTKPCQPGERRQQWNRHRCCFNCVACPSGTFLNRS